MQAYPRQTPETPEPVPSITQMRDHLGVTMDFVRLAFMATDGLSTHDETNAFATTLALVDDRLVELMAWLDATKAQS